MKAAIVALAAFVVSLAVSTGVIVKTTAHSREGAGGVVVDSAVAASADSARPSDSGQSNQHDESHDERSTVVPAASPQSRPQSVVHESVSVSPSAEREAKPSPTGPSSASAGANKEVGDSTSSQRQVARILSQMKPADAARLVELLGDDEAEKILRSLGAKPAALLLAHIEPQRATALTRRLLGTGAARPRQ